MILKRNQQMTHILFAFKWNCARNRSNCEIQLVLFPFVIIAVNEEILLDGS